MNMTCHRPAPEYGHCAFLERRRPFIAVGGKTVPRLQCGKRTVVCAKPDEQIVKMGKTERIIFIDTFRYPSYLLSLLLSTSRCNSLLNYSNSTSESE